MYLDEQSDLVQAGRRKGAWIMGKNIMGLVLWVLGALAAGWVGSNFMPGEWYAALTKPSWNPPSSVFAPVWTVLYVLMGVAAWLVWRQAGFSGGRVALSLFLVQLVLNSLWSYLFFGLQNPLLALIEIIVLWCAILATLVSFWRISSGAGALLTPYLAWVTFASALNYQLWRLNA
jgi:tryptophan-rich sensory protein